MNRYRRCVFHVGFVACCLIALTLVVATAVASDTRPNIMLVLADDLGRDKPNVASACNAAAMRWLDDLDAPRMIPNLDYRPQ